MTTRRTVSPAYWFLLPALSVIALFFFVPVIAALLLSLTDFDIYALADRANLRIVGQGNYAQLLHDPRVWIAFKNTLYFVVATDAGAAAGMVIYAVLTWVFTALAVWKRKTPID